MKGSPRSSPKAATVTVNKHQPTGHHLVAAESTDFQSSKALLRDCNLDPFAKPSSIAGSGVSSLPKGLVGFRVEGYGNLEIVAPYMSLTPQAVAPFVGPSGANKRTANTTPSDQAPRTASTCTLE